MIADHDFVKKSFGPMIADDLQISSCWEHIST
jgi:hypothetical protein